MKKKLLPVLVMGIASAWSMGVHASVTFDFQNGQVIDVGSFDWTQTSFVAVNGVQAVDNFAADDTCPNNSCDFTILSHASLTGVKDTTGADVTINGLGSDFEITVTFGFTETVTGLSGAPGAQGTLSTFETKPNSGEFLEVYYDTAPNSVDLSGSGFNDGQVILAGSLVGNSFGNFTLTNDDPVQFDQFPAGNTPTSDNYGDGSNIPGQSQLTLSGFGTQNLIRFDSLTQNNSFFLSQLDTFGFNFNNVSIGLPFLQTNPSDCFTNSTAGFGANVASGTGPCTAAHVDGLYSAQGADGNGGYVPNTGNINATPGEQDFVAQTDYNTGFDSVAVPEPASLALLGIGLIGLGFTRSRKRNIA
ncbi:PEP-CTERM sorting domain-containing protein [Nitrosococcus oceani]|uniref:PEP-CTERM sorting domain-containing protein n=1 Tax=Nitrosococcus oceani TaxID=1229 RepID=UPI0004E8E0C9|nr:PEP-CTERM sorting domain-containing protein [Nitrosococcus oceani]KFI22328.1 hypothetical protein HW44_10050 [Nitrosococcus oceani]